ncbi:MAG: DUF364 domain-containing protein [Candidatus Lokiarchaeota archaeon]|nr:DUF364 domain-containing protein [Candidatus Lokiarchaeota archaeon]
MILEKTLEHIKQIFQIHEIIPPKVTKIVIGLGYTGVRVSAYGSESVIGLASTLSSLITSDECSKVNFAGDLTNKNLLELLEWSYLPPSLKRIIGIATLNAVSQYILKIQNPYFKVEEDLVDYLGLNLDTKITIIGLMKPLIRKLSKKTLNITLVEDRIKKPLEFNKFDFHSNIDELNEEDLSTDILFCTGTVLINNTIEKILDLFRGIARKIIVIGPSVGLLPDILFEYGVDIVGGMEILDTKATLKVLQEGGGTQMFKNFGKKYNLLNK